MASAIVREAENRDVDYHLVIVHNFSSITGKGITGSVEDRVYFIGSPQLFEEYNLVTEIKKQISNLQEEGKTVMVFGTEANVLALIAVADEIRETSKEAIRKLHAMGIEKTIMLTGDNLGTAKAIGASARVDEIQAELIATRKTSFY